MPSDDFPTPPDDPPPPRGGGLRHDVPEAAPIQDPPDNFNPEVAPVDEAGERAKHAVELTKILLMILAGSIVLLVAYLWVLDYKTSDKVDQMYDRIFSAVQPTFAPPETSQINEVLLRFGDLSMGRILFSLKPKQAGQSQR